MPVSRVVVIHGRMWTASTHFFVWNDPLCTFYLRLWPCEGMAAAHFFLGLHPCLCLMLLPEGVQTPSHWLEHWQMYNMIDLCTSRLNYLPIDRLSFSYRSSCGSWDSTGWKAKESATGDDYASPTLEEKRRKYVYFSEVWLWNINCWSLLPLK